MLKLADILQNGLTDTLKLADIIKLSHDLDWLVYWLADMLKLTDILQNGLTDMLKLADIIKTPPWWPKVNIILIMKSWLTDLLRCWNWLNSWLTYWELADTEYWKMKKLDHDWPSDTLEMADWVAYLSKLADWLADRLKTCWPEWLTFTEKRADWHAETGWLTRWLVTTSGHLLTICWLGVTEILKNCMTDLLIRWK